MSDRSLASRIRHHDLPPGQVVVAGCLGTAVVTGLSLWAYESLDWIFAWGFVAVCATLPLAATRSALLTSIVMPPLLMGAVAASIAIWWPGILTIEGLGSSAGTLQRTIAGLADQGSILGIACLVTLLAAGLRQAGLKNSSGH